MLTEVQVKRYIENYLDKSATTYAASDTDPMRYWTLRPSGFPYCGLRKLLSAGQDMETPRLEQLSSDYFTSVGTTTHSVFQRFAGLAGSMLGDWKCKNKKCGFLLKFSTYKRCPKCDFDVEYKELEVKYKDTVVGHIDNLYRINVKMGNKSPHALIDYKTTMLKRVKAKKSPFPYGGNVAQIEKYVPLAEDQYGIKIDWWSLIYLARDAPFKFGRKVIVHALTEAEKNKHRKILDRWVKVHRHVLIAETAEDFAYVRKYKFCESEQDYSARYRDEYNECPYRNDCFDDGLMDKVINEKRKHKVYPLIQHIPEYVKKELKL